MSNPADVIYNSAYPGGGGADFLKAHADMETEDDAPAVVIPLEQRNDAELRAITLNDPDVNIRRRALDLLLAMRVAEAVHRMYRQRIENEAA